MMSSSATTNEKNMDPIEETRERIKILEKKLEGFEATGQISRAVTAEQMLLELYKKENLLLEAGCIHFAFLNVLCF